MTEPGALPRGTYTFLFTDIEGSTDLEDPDRTRSIRTASRAGHGRSCATPGSPTAGSSRAPRAIRSSSSFGEAPVRGRRGGRRPARDRRRTVAATTPRSGSGWASTRAAPRSAGDSLVGLERQPGGPDRGGRPRRPDPGLRPDPGPAGRRSARGRPPARPRRAPAQGPDRAGAASSRSRPTACRRRSRRSGRSTPGRTTCRSS